MSHELRTPMNAILGIAQIQMQKGELSRENADAFAKIYNSGSTLLGILNDILDMSKIETEKIAERIKKFDIISENQLSQITRVSMPYGKVLVVDDVETNLYIAEGLMAPYGLEFETAESGFEVIEKIADGAVYDVIFMDHMMPEMDGIETTNKLRAGGYKGIIVALTANALAGNDEIFKLKGFDEFMSKPIDIRTLNTILNKYIRDKYPEEAAKYKSVVQVSASPAVSVPTDNPKLLKIFCRDAGKAIIALRETAASGDFKLYTTTAHAMKSALANVGESKVSELAYSLEKAGLKGDIDFIAENTEAFIANLVDLVSQFTPAHTSAGAGAEFICSEDDTIEDRDFLKEQLLIMKDACEDYDRKSASSALETLQDKKWKVKTTEALEEIHEALFLHSDFEGAEELVKKMLDDIYCHPEEVLAW
jgi:CheY-like chemotaxis protein